MSVSPATTSPGRRVPISTGDIDCWTYAGTGIRVVEQLISKKSPEEVLAHIQAYGSLPAEAKEEFSLELLEYGLVLAIVACSLATLIDRVRQATQIHDKLSPPASKPAPSSVEATQRMGLDYTPARLVEDFGVENLKYRGNIMVPGCAEWTQVMPTFGTCLRDSVCHGPFSEPLHGGKWVRLRDRRNDKNSDHFTMDISMKNLYSLNQIAISVLRSTASDGSAHVEYVPMSAGPEADLTPDDGGLIEKLSPFQSHQHAPGASLGPTQEEADRWSYPAAGISMSRAVLVKMIEASGSSPDSMRAAHPLFQAYFGISIAFARFALAAPPEWYAQQAALNNKNPLLSKEQKSWQAKSEANKEFGLDLSTDKLKDWFQVDSLKI